MYAKNVWARVIKNVKINPFFAEALLKGFDQMWGAKGFFLRRDK